MNPILEYELFIPRVPAAEKVHLARINVIKKSDNLYGSNDILFQKFQEVVDIGKNIKEIEMKVE